MFVARVTDAYPRLRGLMRPTFLSRGATDRGRTSSVVVDVRTMGVVHFLPRFGFVGIEV
ncbi:MAG: hypothetical protein P1V35_16180 [Planctomycetota bacterium]|nr:hypothetical protein [Planctomycetota bacterium]